MSGAKERFVSFLGFIVNEIPFAVLKTSQSYKHHVERISQDLAGHEPEVCLAVRIPPESIISLEKEDEPEDDSEIDAFLSSHGFEYIDAVQVQPLGHADEIQTNDGFAEGEQVSS